MMSQLQSSMIFGGSVLNTDSIRVSDLSMIKINFWKAIKTKKEIHMFTHIGIIESLTT